MAEPSYYPLSPLKSRPEGDVSPTPEDLKDNDLPDPSHSVAAKDHLPSLSSKFRTPLHPQPRQKSLSVTRPPLWHAVKAPLVMALFPLAAIGYLAFCYTVHGRAVPVNTLGLYNVTPEHFATIKGGVTSITIIIISIALFPICNIISDLKSEEFFRSLASHSHGVPLETIDHISTPSFGRVDAVMAMWNHTCSNYYILGIVTSFLVWIVTTLAPGALTINSVLADGALMAFAVGAVFPQSVLNGTSSTSPAFNASLNSVAAASVAWAEMELGVQYSFGVANTSEPGYTAFIVPDPLDLSTSMSARWLTDVIGINPSCSWPSTNLTTVQVPASSSNFSQYFATANLADFNLDVEITSSDLQSSSPFFAIVKDPTSSVTNHSTQALPSDGSTVFLLGQCQSGCTASTPVNLTLDLSGVSTTFTVTLTDQTWSMAILACVPNIAIETREVRNDGHGRLSVQSLPAGRKLTRQGNLDALQTRAMFSIATMSLSQKTGQLYGTNDQYWPLGSQLQGDVLFGKAQYDSLPGINAPTGTSATIRPAPIDDITRGYTQTVQSAAKPYLAGYLGAAYVPGRLSASDIVFAAAIPNLAVATAVFALLAAVLVLAHFRPGKGTEFTLTNVAAAVHDSELPALCARTVAMAGGAGEGEGEGESEGASEDGSHPHTGDVQSIADMGDRRVLMQRRADGSPTLYVV